MLSLLEKSFAKKVNHLKKSVQAHPLSTLLLSLLLLLILSTHLLWLNNFPPGLTHDEVEYSLSSKTFALQGVDLSGYGFPTALFKTETEGRISLVPVMLLSPISLIFPLTQTTARLPYFFLSLLSAGALFFLAESLFTNKKRALLSSFLFLMSPWAFYLSRNATESSFALLFFLVGVVLLLRSSGKILIWSFLFFVLGFFSYHGAKIVVIPVVFVCLLYRLYGSAHKLSRKEAVFFLASILFLFVGYFGMSSLFSNGILSDRVDEVFFLDKKAMAEAVDSQRHILVENPITGLFINKYTLIAKTFLQKYLGAFSPEVLFFSGDTRIIYGFQQHGLLYFVDLLFIASGMFVLFIKKRSVFWLLLSLLLIAPLASGINAKGTSYVHRAFLLLPVFILFGSIGVVAIFGLMKKYSNSLVAGVIISLVIGFSFANFLFFYFFQYPVVAAESYGLGERLVSKYILESQKINTSPIFVAAVNPRDTYLESLVYLQDNERILDHLNRVKKFNAGEYITKGVKFLYDCPSPYDPKVIYLIRSDKVCSSDYPPSGSIRNPKDGGIIYNIYNSHMCDGKINGNYQRFHLISDYDVENMDKDTFCSRWITSN